jgi:hypothetical protein
MAASERSKRSGESREHRRFRSKIPAHVEIVHAWEGTSVAPALGEVYNISRSGAGLRLDRVLPPRTRLRVAITAMGAHQRLGAEVVWTSAVLGAGNKSPAVYGVRWLEQLSSSALESLLPAPALRDDPDLRPHPGA